MYLNGFENVAEIYKEYNVDKKDIDFVKEILYAAYHIECYEGYSHVIFKGVDGKLYDVHGSHCSCYGLEDQWSPEETSLEYYFEKIDRGVNVDPKIINAIS